MKQKYLIQLITCLILLNKIDITYATTPNVINTSVTSSAVSTSSDKQTTSEKRHASKKTSASSASKNTPSSISSMSHTITTATETKTKSSSTSTTPVTPELAPDKVVLNFENADIQSVIKAISQLSGKNFVIDPRVKGTINIVSDKPISKADSYRVLESALRMQGFASVESDGVVKVLPESDAKTYGMKTYSQSSKSQPGDQVITKIFVISHGSAMQLSNALRPLIAPNNSISTYANSNAIIVTDYASNMNRIGTIIEQLSDTSGVKSAPTMITLKNAIASDVAQVLQSYLQGGGSSSSGGSSSNYGGSGNTDGPNTTITVDAATNSVILYSVIKDKLDELKALALRLDENTGKLHNNIHVVYLKNGDAAHIADVLRVVATSQENPDLTATSSLVKFAEEPRQMFSIGSGSNGSSGSTTQSSNSNSKQSSANRGSTSGGNNQNQKDAPKVFIQAEPTTNSLIIQAPDALYKNLRMVIEMLDVRRAQIMIEALLVTMDINKSGAFGIQWVLGGGANNAGAILAANYAGNNNSLSSLGTTAYTISKAIGQNGSNGVGLTAPPSIPNEVYVGLVTGTTTIGGQTIPTLGALADMIDSNNSAQILSRPTLITMDNEEAKIKVGINIGIPNGTFQNTAAAPSAQVTTITRQELGTFLQIKPLITQNGGIQLDIYQEDSSLNSSLPQTASNGPSYNSQYMRATLMVDDGQIIAIGGLTKDQVTLITNAIPILGSIPYLGWLFSWQYRSHIKENLVLFLRPVIIKSAQGYAALTSDRYKYIIDQQKQVGAKGNALLPSIAPVTLDNQLPYKMTVPKNQPDNLVKDLPIIDMRESVINNNINNINNGLGN
jgi:general secretion pathway protein D